MSPFLKLSFCVLFSFFALQVVAQVPLGVRFANTPDNGSPQICPPGMGNFAGTFSLGAHNGQSTNTDLDTIYLCAGDEIFIDHNGDQDLSGDPNPATQAGVGYAFYECPPTVGGPDLATIQTDPCLANNTTPPPGNGIWITTNGGAATPDESGDLLFVNTGFIQDFFFATDPGLLWFAPITYDDYDASTPNNPIVFEGSPEGPCVDVNTDEAFAVVYLNPIQIDSIRVEGCQAFICIDGGLPEFEDTRDYIVTASLSTDTSIKPDVFVTGPGFGGCGSFSSQAMVRLLNVPQEGVYNIVIADRLGCTANTFQVDINLCPQVVFDIEEVSGAVGDTVCVPIVVSNFNQITGFEFSIRFDTNVVKILELNPIGYSHPNLISSIGTGPLNPNMGQILTVSWLNFLGNGIDIPENDTVFTVCFEIVGNVGDVSDITFDPNRTLEVTFFANSDPYNVGSLIPINGSATVIEKFPLLVDFSQRNVSCGPTPPNIPASNDGAIFIEPQGGIPPYSYIWQREGDTVSNPIVLPSGQSDSITNLSAGTYYVTVSDSDLPPSILIDTFIITEPLVGLGVNPMATDPLCAGDDNGTFNIVVNGGTPPYSFLWNTGDTIQNLDSLSPGFYQVVVTDANGCQSSASASLFNPAALVSMPGTIPAACEGVADGTAWVDVQGGNTATPYTFEWSTSPTQVTDTIRNLDAGDYFVTVTDASGCEVIDTVTVGIFTSLDIQAVVTNISCFENTDGAITVMPIAMGRDNGGYLYSWSGPGGTFVDANATDLQEGSYDIVITDALGCVVDSSYMITRPDSLTITLVNLQHEQCPDGMNGSIQVTASGGTLASTSNYDFNWSTGANGPLINNLIAGSYSLTVTDDNNCQDSASYEVLPPLPPTIDSFQVVDASCPNENDGQITVFFTPQSAGIVSIEWSNGNTGNPITDLLPADYIVTITDSSGCMATDTATVGSPPAIDIQQAIITPPVCNGDSNAQVTVQITGGTAPIVYLWSDGQTTNPAVGLSAGDITVSITDANNCPSIIRTFNVPVTPEVSITIDTNSITGVSCYGGVPCDGSATAFASGGGAGTGFYTYNWSSGFVDPLVNSSTAIDLCQGLQSLIVSDPAGCSAETSFMIPSPDSIALDLAATTVEDVSCFGNMDGSITVDADGGIPPYNYFWPASSTTGPNLNNLGPNTYELIVTDNNNCTNSFFIEIQQPAPLMLQLDSAVTENPTCEGDDNGTIAVKAIGGNIDLGSENYAWSSDPVNAPILMNLRVGTYTVTVTDIKGCTATLVHSLAAPPPIQAVFDTLPSAPCFGNAVTIRIDTIFGGSISAYTTNINGFNEQIVLQFPHDIGPVPPGENIINILDRNSCISSFEVFISQPPEIIVDLGPDITVDLGDSFNIITATFPNGQDLGTFDSLLWTPLENIVAFRDSNMTKAIVAPLETTTYKLIAVDSNGCMGMDNVLVTVDRRRNVYIPNVFSPNDDGKNDRFVIRVGQDVRTIRNMQIFDRWGELVFARQNFLPGLEEGAWDGTFKGDRLDPGVFVYLLEVEFVDERVLLYRGSITIVR